MVPLGTQADLERWERLDDVIMGGQSSSTLSLSPEGEGTAVFSGELVVEGGGFCGTRSKVHPFVLQCHVWCKVESVF